LAGDISDPEMVQALKAVVRMLEDMGHAVEEAFPQIDEDSYLEAFGVMVGTEVVNICEYFSNAMSRPINQDTLEPVTLEMY
jgi:hypothetical protein